MEKGSNIFSTVNNIFHIQIINDCVFEVQIPKFNNLLYGTFVGFVIIHFGLAIYKQYWLILQIYHNYI